MKTKMMRYKRAIYQPLLPLFLSLWFILSSLGAAEEKAAHLTLKGFLGKDELAQARLVVDGLSQSTEKYLIIEISSSSGDLKQVLDIAKSIYELKYLRQIHVIVYIDGNAIGPAAAIPFLAEELYISPFVSWGDIPLGTEGLVPANILRNRVRSLVADTQPHAALLTLMADAMSDPSVGVMESKGEWQPFKESKDAAVALISPIGQTLVVNQAQLKQLGIAKGVLLPNQFEAQFGLKKETVPTTVPSKEESSFAISLGDLEERLKKHIPFSDKEPNTVGYIAINDRDSAITQATWLYVKQALDYYKKNRPSFIILELNTPGGEVFAAERIADALKEMDTQDNVPVVAFINNWAMSAGAMLAYSCRFITVVKDGSMGAAEPVYAGQEGQMVTASEKINSALRADFANRASFFDRNPLIAEAMVDKNLILVIRHNKIVKLEMENQIRISGPNPDIIFSPKGKLLTLTAEQLLDYGVADLLLLPAKVEPITPEEKEKGKWPASQMLLFQQPFFDKIPQAFVDEYKIDWKTKFFAFLASPMVSSLLFMGLFVGAYIEISSPGIGLAGGLAAVCLTLIILSSFALELVHWLELIIFLTGLLIVLVELFVLPTAGLLGLLGVILLLGGLFGMMLPIGSVNFEYDTKTVNGAGEYFFNRLIWLCGALLVSVGVIVVLARYVLAGFSRFNPLVLRGNEQEGYVAVETASTLPQPGTEGVVFATLRPGGKVMIYDKVYDSISEGGFIEAGTNVVVMRAEEGLVVVNVVNAGKSS
jgi:membrane-bound serine protease (ClpP class)